MSWEPGPELLDDVRRVLAAWPADEPGPRFERDAWLSLLETVGPPLLTRDRAPAHVTASAVVLTPDGARTCLILHRKTGLWLQPGGHLEPGDTRLSGAAAREAQEETGLTGTVLDVPARLDRHKAPCAPGVVDWHLDVEFVLVTEAAEPVPSDETPQVAWWPVDELPPGTGDGVAELVAAGRARLG